MPLTVTLHAADLELVDNVRAADREHRHRTSLFLEIQHRDHTGWGECATAMQRGPDATVDDVVAALNGRVLEAALGPTDVSARSGAPALVTASKVSSRPADLAAAGLVDAALLDLRLRQERRSLADELGVQAASVGFAGVIGLDDAGAARDRAVELVERGATRLRVKVSPDSGAASVVAVLADTHVPVVADCNGAFRQGTDDAALDELGALPLAWLEQPYAVGNLAGHAELAARVAVPLGLDESIRSVRAVRDVARYGAASVICCKPARVGGIAKSLEVRREAARLGLRSYVGGYFEAGLGRAVLGVLAAERDDGLDGDVAAPATYLEVDPCALDTPVRGRQPLYRGDGCGPPPARDALRTLAQRTF
ncbi:MAG TPA: enolase C-terminal domain-like protein [Acidimicrobiales bacterium]